MFNQIQFGKRIQQLRKVHGLTQKQAAERLNISPNHLAKLEIGIGSPSIDLCIGMTGLYRTSLDYLIIGEEMPADSYQQVIRRAIEILLWLELQAEHIKMD